MELSLEDRTPGDHAESNERLWGVYWLFDIDSRYHPEHMGRHVEFENYARRGAVRATPRSPGKSCADVLPPPPQQANANGPHRRRLLSVAVASSIRRMKRA